MKINQKKGVTTLVSDKVDFKEFIKDREGHYIAIKGSIQEAIAIPNV